MALSPDAAALKEQALHNADAVLRANELELNADVIRVRIALALAYLNGHEDGTAGMGAARADARRYLMGSRRPLADAR